MILNRFVLLFSLPSPKTKKIFLSHLFKIISQSFLTLPGHAHEFTGLDCSVILEHDQSQLSRDLNGMISEQLRPVISRVLDMILCWGRRAIKIKDDLSDSLVIVQSPLNNFADALHPLPHGLAGDIIEEGGESVEEVSVLGEIIEMLINPVLTTENMNISVMINQQILPSTHLKL